MSGLFATWILRTSQVSRSVISLPASASGAAPCDLPDGPTTNPSGQALALASPSAPQASVAALTTSATSGPSCSVLSASAALQSSLASRLQAKMACSGSTLYKLTWKERATPAQRQIFARRASAPRTSDSVCTGWPTPNAGPQNDTDTRWEQRREEVKAKYGHGHNGFGMTLGMASTLTGWPTTTTRDWKDGSNPDVNVKLNALLGRVVWLAGWRTPTCQSPNSLRGEGQDPAKRLAQGHTVNLTDEVNWLKDNPQPARLTATGEMLTGSSAAMESGGQLNPAHSRWLMGLPPEWDACAPTATPSSRKSRKPS